MAANFLMQPPRSQAAAYQDDASFSLGGFVEKSIFACARSRVDGQRHFCLEFHLKGLFHLRDTRRHHLWHHVAVCITDLTRRWRRTRSKRWRANRQNYKSVPTTIIFVCKSARCKATTTYFLSYSSKNLTMEALQAVLISQLLRSGVGAARRAGALRVSTVF